MDMARIRSSNTKPEVIVRKALFTLGYRYRINYVPLPGKPDIVFTKKRIVIFVNGCFWHQHNDCKRSSIPKTNTEYWIPKLKGNVERDRRNIDALRSANWQCITVWECQTKKLDDVIKYLVTQLGEKRASSS